MIQTADTPPQTPDIGVPESITSGSFWHDLKGLGFDDAISKIANGLISFGFKLVIAILVFYLGRFIIKKLYKVVYNMMTTRQMDPSLTTFVLSLVRMTLYFILIITVIGILGIETSSFIAIFASAGVAIGMALSGTLQNFAGGVLILLLKPYKVGDFIEVQGYTGTVKSIQLFNTIINTIDNKAIIIPNGALSTSSINNYSLEQYRRVDWSISLAYGTSFASAKEVILSMLAEDKRLVKKFVEDDMEYREHLAEIEREKHPEANPVEQEKKRGFFYRMFHRSKKAVHTVADNSSFDLNVALPSKADRSPFVGLSEMGDSAIVITVRAWTHASNYWPVFFEMNERFYTELPEHGFSFPFPQLDVHMA